VDVRIISGSAAELLIDIGQSEWYLLRTRELSTSAYSDVVSHKQSLAVQNASPAARIALTSLSSTVNVCFLPVM